MEVLNFLVYPFLACLLLIVIHAYFGIHILQRGIIFVDLALAQFIGIGIALSFLLGEEHGTLLALAFAMLGAFILSLSKRVARLVNIEAFIGVLYIFSVSAAILILDRSPHGLEEFKTILNGNIIWVTPREVFSTFLVYGAVGLLHFILRKQFFALTFEGKGNAFLEFLFFASFAVVLVKSVKLAGILQVFSFLVIPALIGRLFSLKPFMILMIGWSVGVLITIAGIALVLHTGRSDRAGYRGRSGAVVLRASRGQSRGRKGETTMKNIIRLSLAIAISISIVACADSMKQISRMSQSERVDVFTEVTADEPVPSGFSDVVIKASIKTPLEGYYSLESKESAHGKPDCTFLVNIDGQAVQWKVAGQKHELPAFIDGKTSRDPEAGEGMKYVLEKKVRLASGAHNVFFGLPGDAYCITTAITLKSGVSYVLEYKPVYWYKRLPTRIPTFLKGIERYEVVVRKIGAL